MSDTAATLSTGLPWSGYAGREPHKGTCTHAPRTNPPSTSPLCTNPLCDESLKILLPPRGQDPAKTRGPRRLEVPEGALRRRTR